MTARRNGGMQYKEGILLHRHLKFAGCEIRDSGRKGLDISAQDTSPSECDATSHFTNQYKTYSLNREEMYANLHGEILYARFSFQMLNSRRNRNKSKKNKDFVELRNLTTIADSESSERAKATRGGITKVMEVTPGKVQFSAGKGAISLINHQSPFLLCDLDTT